MFLRLDYCLWSALQDPQSDERFHVELHFSPGAYCVGQNKEYPAGRGYRPQHGEKKQVFSFSIWITINLSSFGSFLSLAEELNFECTILNVDTHA